MAAVQTVFLCVAGALVCALMRVQRPEFRLAVALCVGLCALGMSMDGLRGGVDVLRTLAGQAGMAEGTASVMLRATGIALLAEFGAQLCRDAGESSLAGRVELAARAALIALAAPLMTQLTGRLAELLP